MTVALAGAAAHAAPPPTRVVALEVVRDAGAEVCPDERAVAADVIGRLGRDPFVAAAPERVLVSLSPARRGFVARITLIGAPPFQGVRTLRTRDPACAELGETVALAIAVAIDPLVLTRPTPPPLPPGPIGARRGRDLAEVRRPITRRSPEPTPPPPPPTPLVTELGLAASSAIALSPGVTVGPRIWGGVRGDGWSLAGGVVIHLLGEGDVPGGRVAASLIAGELEGCLRVGPWSACATLGVGGQSFGGDGVTGGQEALWIAPGIRAGARASLTPALALEVTAAGSFPVTRARVRVDDAVVWETPAATLVLGLGLVLALP